MITQKFAEPEIQLDFKDVLIKPKQSTLSSRSQVHLAQEYKFKHSPHTYHGIPVIAANMDTVGTMTAAKVMASHHCMVALHKHYSIESLVEFFGKDTTEEGIELLRHNKHHLQHTFYSMGMVQRDLDKFREVVSKVGLWKVGIKDEDNSGIKMVCIDVANGYMDAFVSFCKQIHAEFPSLIIMAGNVVTYEMTKELLENGVSIVKTGIGSGSVCTTRVTAGVGRPQLSAILDCQRAAEECGGYVVSDGGITCIGDFPRAFGAGVWGVMAGGMFAGHEESEMEIIEKDGKKFMQFYGMSSAEAMYKYAGGVAEYRASEGKKVEVPFKGSLDKTISDILGGIRSAHTYVGATHLKEFASHVQYFIVKQEVNEYWGRSK